jgi:hypothetical protein
MSKLQIPLIPARRRYVVIFDGQFKIIRQNFSALLDEHVKEYTRILAKDLKMFLNYTICDGTNTCQDCIHQLQCDNYHSD